jgi:hypothetical protein
MPKRLPYISVMLKVWKDPDEEHKTTWVSWDYPLSLKNSDKNRTRAFALRDKFLAEGKVAYVINTQWKVNAKGFEVPANRRLRRFRQRLMGNILKRLMRRKQPEVPEVPEVPAEVQKEVDQEVDAHFERRRSGLLAPKGTKETKPRKGGARKRG